MIDLDNIFKNHKILFKILKTVYDLDEELWICAGFVRNNIWNSILNKGVFLDSDIDVIYFDSKDISVASEDALKEKLKLINPSLDWSVKNQARMSIVNNIPYKSMFDAVSKFPETATSICIRLNALEELEFYIPYGLDDIENFVIRPTPYFKENTAYVKDRFLHKGWKESWPNLVYEAPR